MSFTPRKTSVYVDETLDSILAERDGGKTTKVRRHGRRSRIFREMVRRYDEICKADIPELDALECKTLLPTGSGWAEGDIDGDIRMGRLFAVVRNSERLLKKLVSLRAGERFALVDTIERYWAAKSRGEQPEIPNRKGSVAAPKAQVRAGTRK